MWLDILQKEFLSENRNQNVMTITFDNYVNKNKHVAPPVS